MGDDKIKILFKCNKCKFTLIESKNKNTELEMSTVGALRTREES